MFSMLPTVQPLHEKLHNTSALGGHTNLLQRYNVIPNYQTPKTLLNTYYNELETKHKIIRKHKRVHICHADGGENRLPSFY